MANAYQTFDLVKTNDVLVNILCYFGKSCLMINVNYLTSQPFLVYTVLMFPAKNG